MKLVFTLAASALLATVPITASPIIPNTFTNTAVGKKDTVIFSAATVSNIVHPTTTIVSLRPEVSEAAHESDGPDYTTSDSEDNVSDEDASADESTSSHLTTRQDGTCSGNSSRLCVEEDKCLCAECKSGSYSEDCKFTAITPDKPKAKRSVIPPSAASIIRAANHDYDSQHKDKQTERPHRKKDLSDGSSSSESHLNFLTRRIRPLPEGYHCPHKSFFFGCKDDTPNECACYWRTTWSAHAEREIPVRDSEGTPLKRSLDGPSTSTPFRAVLVEDEDDFTVSEEDFHRLPRDIFRRMIADDLHCATPNTAMRCSLTTEVCSCWKDGMKLDEQPVNGGSDWSWEKQRDEQKAEEQKRKAEEEKAKKGAKRSLSPPSASASGLDGDYDFLPVDSLTRRSSHTAEFWKPHLPPHLPPTSHNRRGPQSHTGDYWNHHPPASSPKRRAPGHQELSQDDKDIKNTKRGLDVDVQRRSPDHPGIKCTKTHEFPFCKDIGNITIETCSCASYQKNATTGFHYLHITGPAEKDDSDAPKHHERDLSDGVDDSSDAVDSGSYHLASDGKKRDSIEDINSFDSGSYGSYLPADVDDHNSMPIARRADTSNFLHYHCSNSDWVVRCGRNRNKPKECRCYGWRWDGKKAHLDDMDKAINNKKRDVSAGDDEADLVPLSQLSGDLVARKLASSYYEYCTDPRAKIMCEQSKSTECWCYTDETEKTETGESVTTMVKGDKPVRDSDSNSNNEDIEGCEDNDKEEDEKPADKRDVTSDSDFQATNVHYIISPTVGRRSGGPTGDPGYYCANKEAKMVCMAEDFCGCMVKGENGKPVNVGWPIKDGGKPKRRDLDSDSDSVEPVSDFESDFETKFRRANPPLQFDVAVTLPAEVVKALGPRKRDILPGNDAKNGKKRDVEVKREVEEHLPEASVLERDANGVAPAMEKRKVNVQNHDHELFARGNNGFGTRKVECKETGMIAGFCLINGYCYCLQCRRWPDNCNFAQRDGVGDKKRKRDLLGTIDGSDAEDDSLIEASEDAPAHEKRGRTDFFGNLLKARTFGSEVNTNPKPENMPNYVMHIYSQVIANNKHIQLTCRNSVGGFCFEDGCFCFHCEIALNNCRVRKIKGGRSKRELGDDHDELLTIEGGGDVHYDEKSLINEKRGGSVGLHRSSSFGHPLSTFGRRSPIPIFDNQAVLEKRNKGFECENALGAFCFSTDECYCLRCKKFPDEGCSLDQRKFFTNSKKRRDSGAATVSSEDAKPEAIDVAAPPTKGKVTRSLEEGQDKKGMHRVAIPGENDADAGAYAGAGKDHDDEGVGWRPRGV
ncbi:hypothetical protein N0V85_004673 [Neurospora sp. IMI 360204]|nr:hypothetical protein N0V85_004673 [Neurospora sp. IMI 360204]